MNMGYYTSMYIAVYRFRKMCQKTKFILRYDIKLEMTLKNDIMSGNMPCEKNFTDGRYISFSRVSKTDKNLRML